MSAQNCYKDLAVRPEHATDEDALSVLEPRAGRWAGFSNEQISALNQAVLDGAPVTIYYADNQGQILYANPEYRRTFGLSAKQGIDEWAPGVHPADRAKLEQDWTDFCRRPRAMRFDYRTQDASGAVRYMSETVVAMAGGTGFIGTITDVTELVATRADLHKIEALHRNTFEQLPLGIVYTTREGEILSCNEAFSSMLGYGAEELTGQSIQTRSNSDDGDEHEEQIARLWTGELKAHSTEKRFLKKDGSVFWARVTSALVRDGAGQPECSVGFVEDISTRRRAELALQRSSSLVEAIFTHVPAALAACDSSGAITLLNPAAEELYSTGSNLPTSDRTALYPEDLQIYRADGKTPMEPAERPLARALAGETLTNLEFVAVRPDGTARTVLASACRLLDPSGISLGAVVVSQDITHLRETEAEMERIHKQLMSASRQAGMAEVATNVLHNVGNVLNSVNVSASLVTERLKRSKAGGLAEVAALLKAHDQDLGEFLTHDPRGKLLPTYLAKLAEQLQSEERAALEELASLRSNIEHIKDTVATQQSYAKRCGVAETVDVAEMVEDSLRMNAGALSRHHVALRREFEQVPEITVDKHRVLQILVNLVRNAKYACDESGRTDKQMTVRIENYCNGVRISVIDNGVGIKPENIRRLFRHGFTTRKSGHGFGLHSAALAAGELGGRLSAHSDGEGKGARFDLDLPITPPEVARA
jgi:PAS domain S-box-containing protein